MGVKSAMRLIKAFFIGAAGLLIIITLFSLIIPPRALVSRGIRIDGTNPIDIYRQIAYLENWKKWHPVFTMDSAKLYQHEACVAGKDPGYYILHHEKKVDIRLLSADTSSIHFLLLQSGSDDIDNNIVIIRLPSKAVQVEWRAITKLHWYPWEKFYGIFIDRLTGPGYEAALNGLKEYMEGPLSPKRET